MSATDETYQIFHENRSIAAKNSTKSAYIIPCIQYNVFTSLNRKKAMNTEIITTTGNNHKGWIRNRTVAGSEVLKGRIPEDQVVFERDISSIRCFHCGERFPVTDFLRTQKSGLCRSCWKPERSGLRIASEDNVRNHLFAYSVYEESNHRD